MMFRVKRRYLALLIFGAFASLAMAGPRKVIIDTDPGTDDAMAIMLALNSPEFDVRALTVVPGNVTAAQGLENALRMVSLANRCDILVAGGAQHPLFQKLITAEFWHGQNGLANIELPKSKCKADPRWAPDLIIEMVHANPHEITLVPIGPLTNIALAIEKDPSIVPLVKEVVIMGGSITGGNVNASAEANIANDPEAAQIVFQAGWPLTMVGLAIDSALVKAPAMHVDVETRGEFTRGETVANRRGANERNVLHHFPDGERYVIEGIDKVEPNAKVCTEVNAEK